MVITKKAFPLNAKIIFSLVQERVILHVILRLIIKEAQLVPEIITECLDTFRLVLHRGDPMIQEIIENIMSIIVQDLKLGRDALLKLNKVSLIKTCTGLTIFF